MTFRMNKKQNWAVLIVVICVGVLTVGNFLYQLSKEFSAHTAIACGNCFAVSVWAVCSLILDFKAAITVDETGISMYRRRRQYDLDWKQIRRLEYSGKKWAPAFNTMVIHTSTGEKLYVDYTFKDYKKAWLCIAQHYQTYGEQPIIDKEIWEIAQEEST